MRTLSESERLQRMRDAWQEGAPSDAEVTAARQRTLRRIRMASGGRAPSKFAGLHLDLALGMLGATALIVVVTSSIGTQGDSVETVAIDSTTSSPSLADVRSDDGTRETPTSRQLSEAEATSELAHTPPRIERDGVAIEVTPGMEFEVAEGKSVTVVMGEERTTVAGPRLIEFSFEADRASGFRMHLSSPPRPAGSDTAGAAHGARTRDTAKDSKKPAARAKAREGAAAQREISAWRRAAEAMREGDDAEAERALGDLTRSSSVANRDAAALALAQLHLAAGRIEQARPELERLSRDGSTRLVRRRARELLRR